MVFLLLLVSSRKREKEKENDERIVDREIEKKTKL